MGVWVHEWLLLVTGPHTLGETEILFQEFVPVWILLHAMLAYPDSGGYSPSATGRAYQGDIWPGIFNGLRIIYSRGRLVLRMVLKVITAIIADRTYKGVVRCPLKHTMRVCETTTIAYTKCAFVGSELGSH